MTAEKKVAKKSSKKTEESVAEKNDQPSGTLYRKYRPQSFTDVIGQDHIISTLRGALTANRLAHAYLFTGPRGTGKTTVARLFAQALNCTPRENFTPASENICASYIAGKALDLIEIDAASNTGVENIRSLQETISLAPIESPYKVYIVDEVHMLSTAAFNALLKTLEEPPAHVFFILATTEVHKVPDTILSRCQRHDFTRMSVQDIVEKIQHIADKESIQIDSDAAQMIAISAEGGMRDAESLLAQVFASVSQDEVTHVDVESVARTLGTTTNADTLSLIEAFAHRDIDQAIDVIARVADGGYNLQAFTKSVIVKLRGLLFVSLDGTDNSYLMISDDERKVLHEYAKACDTNAVLMMIDACETALQKIGASAIPQLPLEIAAVKICDIPSLHADPHHPPSSQPTTQKKSPDAKPAEITNTDKDADDSVTTNTSEEAISQATAPQPPAKKSSASKAKSTPRKTDDESIESHMISLTQAKEKWPFVIDALQKENPSLASILSNYTPTKVSGASIVLHVKYDLHKEKLMGGDAKLTLTKVLGTIFELSADQSLHLQAEKQHIAPSNNADEQQQDSISQDVMAHAQAMLGGQVVDEK